MRSLVCVSLCDVETTTKRNQATMTLVWADDRMPRLGVWELGRASSQSTGAITGAKGEMRCNIT